MNPFELIGDDEVIYQMCQSWDTPTLLNMSEAYKRVNDVCKGLIKREKAAFEIKKIQHLINDYTVNFEAKFGNFISKVKVIPNREENEVVEMEIFEVTIFQYISPFKGSDKVPLILPNPAGDRPFKNSNQRIRKWFLTSFERLNLAKNLYEQGYKIIK